MKSTKFMLQRFLQLKEDAAAIEKEMDEIKAVLKKEGSFTRWGFEVDIKTETRNSVVGAEVLLEKLGPVIVAQKGLIKETPVTKVFVKELKRKAA